MASQTTQAIVVTPGSRRPNSVAMRLELFDTDGTAFIVPEQAAAQADVAAMTSAAALTGGEPPTEAEFNQLRADVVALRAVVNSLLAKMRTAKQLAP